MRAVVTVNSADAYEAACLAGLGLIQAPRFGMQELLAQGRLVEVLPALAGAPMPVSLLYPHRRQLSKRVEAFMGWLGEVMAPIVHPA
jgi:DNA-binding transcriptional LysR family regulator